MSEATYKALIIRENADQTFSTHIEQTPLSDLPAHEVLIRVHFAGLNYKDALSASGHKGITKKFPHTPGVDAAGVVVSDNSGRFEPGTEVICTSYDLGMNTRGGFAEYIRVPADWVLPLPENITLEQSMALGTAAFTSGLALHKMERCGQHPAMGPIVVTGAGGGVGTMALGILKSAGYEAWASTGRTSVHDFLKVCGASHIISREETNDTSGRPLLAPKWAGAIDNVGGNTLATLIKACKKEGCIASIGLVDSTVLNTTVYPFILNGVNLLGVDSAEMVMSTRQKVWEKISTTWLPAQLNHMYKVVSLDEIPTYMEDMREGKTMGRIVAKLI